jgi:hypothetical protein
MKKSVPAVAETPQPAVIPHDARQFLTTAQLQEILPLSRRSIFEWRRKGILPSIQVGAKILFHGPSVEAALLRRQSGGVA